MCFKSQFRNLDFLVVNELKDTEKNNPSEKVANYRADWWKGMVPTPV